MTQKTPDEFDKLAYRFWSIHPRDIPKAEEMPERYPGGQRAWLYAKEMRDHALALVAAEREACAKIVYQHALKNGNKIPATYDRIRARTDDDAQAALGRVKREARNEALRGAFNTLRAYAPHHVDGPEHDVGYASGYATAQNRILALIEEDQSDE